MRGIGQLWGPCCGQYNLWNSGYFKNSLVQSCFTRSSLKEDSTEHTLNLKKGNVHRSRVKINWQYAIGRKDYLYPETDQETMSMYKGYSMSAL